jgi:hypothetical protein
MPPSYSDTVSIGRRFVLQSALLAAAEWIVLEHRCCPFLNFKLELTNDSDVWLSLTGPDGVKAFLREAMR